MNLEEEISKSVELLKKGKLLLYPTDTIWGIGCDATNSKAIQKIYKLKGKSENNEAAKERFAPFFISDIVEGLK